MQGTSLEAYHTLNNVGQKQAMVFDAIKTLGKASDLDIANFLDMPINRITPRRNELVEMNLIKEAKRDIHAFTGKRVIFWEVKEEAKKITQEVQKKKGHYFHIKCGSKMKIKIDTEPVGENSMRTLKFLYCGSCNYAEKA